MITVKASQKIFTYAEVTNLTGICAEHLENLVKASPVGLHCTSHSDSEQPDRPVVVQTVGLSGSSDAVPAMCALRSALISRNGVSEPISSVVHFVVRP